MKILAEGERGKKRRRGGRSGGQGREPRNRHGLEIGQRPSDRDEEELFRICVKHKSAYDIKGRRKEWVTSGLS